MLLVYVLVNGIDYLTVRLFGSEKIVRDEESHKNKRA